MTDLAALIAELEKATEGDDEIDVRIYRASHSDDPDAGGFVHESGDYFKDRHCPSYTSSIDAALTLVPGGHWWEVSQMAAPDGPMRSFGALRGMFRAMCASWKGMKDENRAYHDKPALALCIASLKARNSAPTRE